MATRSNIIVRKNGEKVFLYKHHDGQENHALLMDISPVFRVSKNVKEAVSIIKYKMEGVEDSEGTHGDIEYLNIVDLDNNKLMTFKVSWAIGEMNLDPVKEEPFAVYRKWGFENEEDPKVKNEKEKLKELQERLFATTDINEHWRLYDEYESQHRMYREDRGDYKCTLIFEGDEDSEPVDPQEESVVIKKRNTERLTAAMTIGDTPYNRVLANWIEYINRQESPARNGKVRLFLGKHILLSHINAGADSYFNYANTLAFLNGFPSLGIFTIHENCRDCNEYPTYLHLDMLSDQLLNLIADKLDIMIKEQQQTENNG